MLKLENVERQVKFFCEVIGYQFPESKKDDWLLIKVGIVQEEDNCELVDPALETTELVQIQDWFTCLSEKRLPKYAHLTFIEPCISFEFLAYRDGVVRIAVRLGHELKPNFNLKQFQDNTSDWSIVFELGESQFEGILKGIKNTIAKYPVRES